jgi:hypothetical protein
MWCFENYLDIKTIHFNYHIAEAVVLRTDCVKDLNVLTVYLLRHKSIVGQFINNS